jgi:DNA-binding XRE family transcriptional regulator
MLHYRNIFVNGKFAICLLHWDCIYATISWDCKYAITQGGDSIRLAKIRKDQGLSQQRLAELSGVARVTIARFETGRISLTLRTLTKLANALHVAVTELIDEGG